VIQINWHHIYGSVSGTLASKDLCSDVLSLYTIMNILSFFSYLPNFRLLIHKTVCLYAAIVTHQPFRACVPVYLPAKSQTNKVFQRRYQSFTSVKPLGLYKSVERSLQCLGSPCTLCVCVCVCVRLFVCVFVCALVFITWSKLTVFASSAGCHPSLPVSRIMYIVYWQSN